MNIITKKVRLVPAPVRMTRVTINLEAPDSLVWGIKRLPLATGSASATVDWGDGTSTEVTTADPVTHAFASPGTYEVCISDDIESCMFSKASGSDDFSEIYAKRIVAFKTDAEKLTKFEPYCFRNCSNLTTVNCARSWITYLPLRAFDSCEQLAGRLDFPCVYLINPLTFKGALLINEVHFAKTNEAAITSSSGWESSNHTFGAVNATIFFDL